MSPSVAVGRPVWVWSLPAVAAVISYLWFRKKRGALQTDTGGKGERGPECNIQVNQITSAGGDNNNIQSKQEEVGDEFQVELVSVTDLPNRQIVEEDIEVKYCPEVSAVDKQIVEEDILKVEVVQESVKVSFVESDPQDSLPEEEEVGTPVQENLSGKWSKKKRPRKYIPMTESPKMSNPSGREGGEVTLEHQLGNLNLSTKDGKDAETAQRDGGAVESAQERDSANNSPSEVMLASPSLSGYSDTHSEGSSDSGKGCSEVLTPSPTPVSGNSVSGDVPTTCVYEFVIPQHLVGRLIGRNGSYIHEIKDNTHAAIYIKRHPDTPKLKICAIEGSQMDIDSALDLIRLKFPKKRYPNVTLEPVEFPPEVTVPVLPENLHLYLVEGINNDVILSSLISAGHFFLQQPTHPTYHLLNRLDSCMAICYAEPNLPALPDEIKPGILCAAPVHDGWYRAEVTSYSQGGMVDIKFVDYGGYLTIAKTELRQIRADFVTLPFQAAECFLAGVQPVGEECLWCDEAKEIVEKLTLGKVLQAQIHGYTENGTPLIFLFTFYDSEVVCINEELVAGGYAEWLLPDPVTEGCGTFVETISPEALAV